MAATLRNVPRSSRPNLQIHPCDPAAEIAPAITAVTVPTTTNTATSDNNKKKENKNENIFIDNAGAIAVSAGIIALLLTQREKIIKSISYLGQAIFPS